ncbi:DUF6113 family protein [Streptomyces boncukensis]|uniref:Integral membrane protein n=1 Tax=Streptomyces boncukensis TaxID=2711219 RepID=A0A6G4X8K8_9ACTN|nr:hypothetical protein [Streptomyces boncukensis]
MRGGPAPRGDRPGADGPRKRQGAGGAGAARPAAGPDSADWGPWPAVRGARGAVYAALVVLGALTGLAGALVQGAWPPFGLLLSLAGSVGLFWGGAKLCRTRVGAAVPGGGWTVTVLLLTASRPEGDFLFAAGAGSYIYLLGGILAAVICATVALPAPPTVPNRHR